MAIRDKMDDLRGKMRGASEAARRGDLPFTGGFGQAIEDGLSLLGQLRGQTRDRAGAEIERLAERFGFVTRREFEAVRAIAVAAREQAERLAEQLGQGQGGRTSAKAATARRVKTAAKAPVSKAPTNKVLTRKAAGKAPAKPASKRR